MRRSARRHARALSGGAKREGFNAPLGDDVIGRLNQGRAQVAVMVGRSFLSHFPVLSKQCSYLS